MTFQNIPDDIVQVIMSFCDVPILVKFSETSTEYREKSFSVAEERYNAIDQVYSTTFRFPNGCDKASTGKKYRQKYFL